MKASYGVQSTEYRARSTEYMLTHGAQITPYRQNRTGQHYSSDGFSDNGIPARFKDVGVLVPASIQ